MRSSLIVVLLIVVTLLWTSFLPFPVKPAAAQDFDTSIIQKERSECEGNAVCANLADVVVSILSNPSEGSSLIDQSQLNECAGSDNPTGPTLCDNLSAC